ncbi:MAG: BMP family protein [Rhodospirillaceae bacterium]
MKIAAFFVGELHDQGFNASALTGVEAVRAKGAHEVTVHADIPYDRDVMLMRLDAAAADADCVLFIGGQGDRVTPEIAARHADTRFSVIQGSIHGPNIFSYEVRQEESAFLAGVFAALWSPSGVVGHLSGHRVSPGLRARAAFVAGAQHARPDVRVLTSFCGSQDDNAVTKRWALHQFADGAEILFTMLNGGRRGAIEACREAGRPQIGNATDWCGIEPDVFIASAVADIGAGIKRAVEDAENGIEPAEKVTIGLMDGSAVALRCRDDVTDGVLGAVREIERELAGGRLSVPESYDGPEYQPEYQPGGDAS